MSVFDEYWTKVINNGPVVFRDRGVNRMLEDCLSQVRALRESGPRKPDVFVFMASEWAAVKAALPPRTTQDMETVGLCMELAGIPVYVAATKKEYVSLIAGFIGKNIKVGVLGKTDKGGQHGKE